MAVLHTVQIRATYCDQLAESFFFFFNIYLFILVALGLSWGTRDLRCNMRTLSCSTHVGSSSPTRGRTWAPCVGGAESYPLDHQGGP